MLRANAKRYFVVKTNYPQIECAVRAVFHFGAKSFKIYRTSAAFCDNDITWGTVLRHSGINM